MKAVVCNGYGAPSVLSLEEVIKPIIAENQVLVQIKCSTVNSGDVRIRKADPWAVRLIFGFRKPRRNILGGTFSGTIVQIGEEVNNFTIGEEVFGTTELKFGTYAEYVAVNANGLITKKPKEVSWEAAASSVFGATTSLAFLKKIELQANSKVLVYGASGSVGSAMVQLAKYRGAHVSAVCSLKNSDAVSALGANEMVNYSSVNWSDYENKFDVVIDTVNKLDFRIAKKLAKKDGVLVMSAADSANMLKGLFHGWFSKRKVLFGVAKMESKLMDEIKNAVEKGNLTPLIDRSFALNEIREAHAYVEQGHKRGNVVLEIG